MLFLANENFPKASVDHLKGLGLDVTSIGVDFSGITDEEVIAIAIQEDRIILTYDSDYGELIFKFGHAPQAGVIYFRDFPRLPSEAGYIIEQMLKSGDFNFTRTMTVVDRLGVRQKRY